MIPLFQKLSAENQLKIRAHFVTDEREKALNLLNNTAYAEELRIIDAWFIWGILKRDNYFQVFKLDKFLKLFY